MVDWVVLGQMNPGFAIFLGLVFIVVVAFAYWWFGGSNGKRNS